MPRKTARIPTWKSILALGASANSSQRKDALTQAEAPVRELLRVRGFRVRKKLQETLLEFADAGYLEMEQYVALKRMLDLRNAVVHDGEEASAEEVTEKLRRAAAVCEALAPARQPRGPTGSDRSALPERIAPNRLRHVQSPRPSESPPPPEFATVFEVGEEFDVVDASGQTGLQIRVAFDTGGPGGNREVTALFFIEQGAPLRDLDGQYASPSGEVMVGQRFMMQRTPRQTYSASLFIPYSQLHLPAGKHALTYHVRIGGSSGRTLIRSSDRHLIMSMGSFVTVHRISEDVGVMDQSGRLGVEVHVDCFASELQGVPCQLIARFSRADGSPLYDTDGEYGDTYGEVIATMPFIPAGPYVEFTNLSVFLPLTQLHLTDGQYALAFRVIIAKSEGEKWSTMFSTDGRPFEVTILSEPASVSRSLKPPDAGVVQPASLVGFATVRDLREEFDVVDANGEAGLQIHVTFDTGGASGNGAVLAHFYEDDRPLQDLDGRYGTPGGEIVLSEWFTIDVASKHVADFPLFIPYSQLHLSPGPHALRYNVLIVQSRGDAWRTLNRSTDRHFSLNVGSFVTIHRISEDVGTQGQIGQTGLAVHVDFCASGLRDVPCHLLAEFLRADETPLLDQDGQYCDVSGEVAAAAPFKPVFPVAEFTRLSAFLPFTQLHLDAGRHNLAYRIVIRSDGEKTPTWIRTTSRPFIAEVPF